MPIELLSLIPALIVVIIAVKTKRAFEAMVIGSIVGFTLTSGFGFLTSFIYAVYDEILGETLAWVILFTLLLGGLIEILETVRASKAFANLAFKYASSEKKTILMTIIMAIIIFPDEYLRTLTLGSAVKKVSDKNKIPREMLGYIFSALGAPLVVLLPMTTWTIFFSGLLETSGIAESGAGMSAYLKVIPFSFYPIAAILVFLLVIVGVVPKFGEIKKTYKLVESGEYDFSAYVGEDAAEEDTKANLFDFFLPLIILLLSAIFADLLIGTTAAVLICTVYYLFRKYASIDELMESFWGGFSAMIHPMAIIAISFVLASVMDELGFGEVIYMLKPFIVPEVLPFIAFAITGILAYLTGEFWGIAAIMLPAMLPLVDAFDVNVYLYAAAVFSGSVVGSQTCVFGDLNAIISSTVDVKQVDVALNATPYSLIAAAISSVAFLVVGFIV